MADDDQAAFEEIIRGAMPGRVISNYILICEIMSNEGSELSIATSDSLTPWLGTGMLQSALDMMHGAEDIMFLDSEDEE